MSAIRIARSALKVRQSTFRIAAQPLQRRGYADVASDKIKLSLTLPHQVCRTELQALVNCLRYPISRVLTVT